MSIVKTAAVPNNPYHSMEIVSTTGTNQETILWVLIYFKGHIPLLFHVIILHYTCWTHSSNYPRISNDVYFPSSKPFCKILIRYTHYAGLKHEITRCLRMFEREREKNIGSVLRNTASKHYFLYNVLNVILLIYLQSPIIQNLMYKIQWFIS
jgi:hypothetical protein